MDDNLTFIMAVMEVPTVLYRVPADVIHAAHMMMARLMPMKSSSQNNERGKWVAVDRRTSNTSSNPTTHVPVLVVCVQCTRARWSSGTRRLCNKVNP